MHRHQTAAHRPLKRRLLAAVGLFFAVQGVVALIVSKRAKAAIRARDARRPDTYATRAFEEVAIEDADDRAQLYTRGADLMDDMVRAIDAATDHVYVETFIWVDDASGMRLRDAVARAVDRGVRCFVLYDWMLSSRLADDFFPTGAHVLAFRPVTGRDAIRPTNILRDHRKIVTIDSRVGFVGGYNFGDEYLGWRDTHLRISGPSVHELDNAFADFWNQHRSLLSQPLECSKRRDWSPQVTVHRNDPSLAIFPIRGMYLEAIDRAHDSVWITNAYCVPDRAFRHALTSAARRGVDVRILLPGRSNHPLTDALAHGMFDELLAAGVRVFLYRDFMVHAKTATIDGVWTTIGTANLDRWSMIGNYEVNLELRSRELAAQMRTLFELDCRNTLEVKLDTWRRRPLHMRAAEQTLRNLSPLM